MAEQVKIGISDDELLKLLRPDMDAAEGLQQELADDRETYYKRYRLEPYGNERPGWSHSISPVIWNYVQWQLPSLMEVFHPDFFRLKSDNEQRAENFKKLIKFQMFRKQDGYRKLYDFFYYAQLFHYSILKVYKKDDYDLEIQKFPHLSEEEFVQLAQDPNVQITKFDRVTVPPLTNELGQVVRPEVSHFENVKAIVRKIRYSGPAMEAVPPWEFYFSPDATLGDWGEIEARLVYHEVKRTLEYVKKKEKAGLYRKGSYEKCKEHINRGVNLTQPSDEVSFKYGMDGISQYDTQAPSENEQAQEIKIQECYYKYDIDNDGVLEPIIVILADKSVVLSIIENPYMRPPFRCGSLVPEPQKILGIPMPSILDNDQKVMTNLLRLIQDGAAMSVYRNLVTSDSQMHSQLQNRKPFAVIYGDPSRLGEVRVSDPGQFCLKAYELMQAEREEKTGISRYNQGLDADSLNKTATGISIITQSSTRRLRMIAQLLANGPIMGLLRDFIFINQKWPPFMDLRGLGIDISTNPEDLAGAYDIEIDVGTGPAEKQQLANQLDLLVQFGTQAGLQLGIMEPIHILKAQKKKYSILGLNVNDLFIDEQLLAQRQQAMLLQQQAMQQAMMEGGIPGGRPGVGGAGQGGRGVPPQFRGGNKVLPDALVPYPE